MLAPGLGIVMRMVILKKEEVTRYAQLDDFCRGIAQRDDIHGLLRRYTVHLVLP